MRRKVIGVDFGSSQSSISIMNIGTMDLPELLNVTGQKNGFTVPTVLALDANDNSLLAFGNEVYTKYKQIENLKDTIFIKDFKRDLGSSDDNNHYCELFINELANLVKIRFNIPNLDNEEYVTCFAYPASWEDTEKVEILKNLAEKVGFPDVRCIPEPVAAMHTLRVVNRFKFSDDAEYHMVIDFGGGTLDICIIRTDVLGRTPEIISKSGDSKLGGTEFDKIIETLFFRNNRNLSKSDLKIKESTEFHEQIKAAKNSLSEQWLKKDFGEYDFNLNSGVYKFGLAKQDFYQNCDDQRIFEKIIRCIREALKASKLETHQISKVILTGGSSKWFFMREIVANEFKLAGDGIFLTQEPFTDVAKGCAINIGWVAAPLETPGLWIKYRIDNEEWSSPKQILPPNYSTKFDEKRFSICEILGTKYIGTYLLSIKLLERTGDDAYDEISDTAYVEFPAKSNMPFFNRFSRAYTGFMGKQQNKLEDKYYLYFVCKWSKSKYSCDCLYGLELLDDNEYNWQEEYYTKGKEEAKKLPRGKRLFAPLVGGFKCTFDLFGNNQLTPFNKG